MSFRNFSGNFMGRRGTISLSVKIDSWAMGANESLWFCSKVWQH